MCLPSLLFVVSGLVFVQSLRLSPSSSLSGRSRVLTGPPTRSLGRFGGFSLSSTSGSSSSSSDEEKLLAAAARLRSEAAALEVDLGKTPTPKSIGSSSTSHYIAPRWGSAGSKSSLSSLSLDDPVKQSAQLSLEVDVFGSLPPNKLKDFTLNLAQLKLRSGGVLDGETLGVGGEDDVSLDDFKDATIVVVAVSSILALLSGFLLPQNIGATGMYLFALVPIGWISVGSTAPGILAGLIEGARGSGESKEEKIARVTAHEAAHFVCGYVCGLPVRKASKVGGAEGDNCVEFYTSSKGDVSGDFEMQEVNRLAVTAMSGAVGECISLGSAKGIKNDLLLLEDVYRRSKLFLGEQRRQDLTRWSGLTALEILKDHKKEYEALKKIFGRDGTTIVDCIACIEENRSFRDFEETKE